MTVAASHRRDLAVAVLGLAAAGAIALGTVGTPSAPWALLRTLVVAAALILVPGWALLTRVRSLDGPLRLTLTPVASAIVVGVVGVLMLWTHAWQPRPAAIALLVAGALAILVARRRDRAPTGLHPVRFRRRPRLHRRPALLWLLLAVAVVLWAVSLAATDSTHLGASGLLAAYPATWYVAVALTLAACLAGLAPTAPRHYRPSAVAALTIILYASANLVENAPRLPWVYKHIAVTRYLESAGAVDPSIDIYNRWPGFFAVSAVAGEAMGRPDPVAYAAWAEVAFALMDVVLVWAIARSLSPTGSTPWIAALVFVVGNWVGQNYYSPQAFAYTLYLAMCLTALLFLRRDPARWVRWIERRLTRRRRRNTDTSWTPPPLGKPAPLTGGPARPWPPRRTVVLAATALLVAQAVVVVSHQLTPFLAVLTLLPLFALGYFRPKWLGFGLLALALLYVIPNFDYIQTHFGVFTTFDPVANATFTPPQLPKTPAEQLQGKAVLVLSGLTLGLGVVGFVREAWRGHLRRVLVVAWFALAPTLLLFAQSYGGEAKFRIYLFALPWCAIGVAWLFRARPAWPRRLLRVGLGSTLVVMCTLFTIGYFQPEADLRIPRSDVDAAEWLDARLLPGAAVVTETGTFPALIGAHYPYLLRSPGVVYSLTDPRQNDFPHTSSSDIVAFLKAVAADSSRLFIVLSTSQEDYARRHHAFDPGVLDRVKASLAADPALSRVYDRDGTTIYATGG